MEAEASELTTTQRQALVLLAKHGTATVSNVTGPRQGRLLIHSATAAALVEAEYAARDDGDQVTATQKGLRFARLKQETHGERRRRQAAESLAAQESGEWAPGKPGEGAAAESDAAWQRREFARARDKLNSRREEARDAREMVDFCNDWDMPDLLIEAYRREAREAEERVAEAQARLDALRNAR
jgi:hypothetical protein